MTTLTYRTTQPSDALKDIVRYYWFLESEEPYTHHAMADVCPELIFHYRGQFMEVMEGGRQELSFLAGISAPSSQTRKFTINQDFGIFGVYLFPQAIPLLFNIPANELINEMVDLDTLIRKDGAILQERVLHSSSDQERIQLIESFITRKLQKSQPATLPVFEALKHIMRAKDVPKVNQLSEQYFISERQLERQFKRFTGFSPSQFIKINRFHMAMSHYGHRDIRLTDIALACGYYDQSHFIHDFKRFSGLLPADYFTGRTPATDWRESEVRE